MRRVNADTKVRQPEKLIRASTACLQAVRWQRMIWLNWVDWGYAPPTLHWIVLTSQLRYGFRLPIVYATHNRQPETVCAGFTLAV